MSSLLDKVAARTRENVVKSGGGSGRTTYLDRFVDVLTDEDGNPTEAKDRLQVITEISAQILTEQLEEAGLLDEFELTEDGSGKYDIMLAKVNKKVKAQVASAVADNNNNTSVSFNPKYKDKWEVVKEGKTVALAPKAQAED